GGGGLQPSEQAILVDTFPPRKRGMAMAVYAVAILIAPILGPTLGGWITDNYSWRWIFFINVPVGILSVCLSGMMLQDPPYLKAQRLENKKKPLSMDYIGLGLMALGLGCLEVVLDRGQTKDWFGSPIIGFLLSKRLDARWLMVAGMATVAFASFWMSEINLMVAPGQVILPRCIQ